MLGRRIFLTPPRIHSIFTNKCFFSDISILSSREKAIKPFEEVSHLHQQVVRWNNDKMCAYCGKEVVRNTHEKIESVCPTLFASLHKLNSKSKACPLYRHAEVKTVQELRSEIRRTYKESFKRPVVVETKLLQKK